LNNPDTSEDPYPDWHEPATKGDVLTAMIWTEGLVLRTVNLALAASTGKPDQLNEAHKEFKEELADFHRKVAEIAGRKEA
jgi:uncharacterized membrane protein